MKKAFKFMALALMAGALVVACSKDNDNDNSNPDPNPGQSSYSLTFGGQALDVAGYYSAAHGDVQGYHMWLFQCAQKAEGDQVFFPYYVAYFLGASKTEAQVYDIELYKETYLQDANGNMYGDWQLDKMNSLNCTAMDATTGVVSLVANASMYDLDEYVTILNELAGEGQVTEEMQNQAIEETTHQNVVLTLSNITFTAAE
jgi:hypothetical protein